MMRHGHQSNECTNDFCVTPAAISFVQKKLLDVSILMLKWHRSSSCNFSDKPHLQAALGLRGAAHPRQLGSIGE